MLALYVDLTRAELASFGACLGAGYVVEGLVAGLRFRRIAEPVRAWLSCDGGMHVQDAESAQQAWSCAAQLPVALLRSVSLLLLGTAGAVAAGLLLAAMLGLPARDAPLVFPLCGLLYLSSIVLRYLGLELGMRPVLEGIGRALPEPVIDRSHVSLHRRLVAAVPTVTWATGVIVGGLLTENTRRLNTIGLASMIALGVTTVVSTWLSLVLADAVSGPIVDLRDATRRVAAGDLSARVPVVSTDETGELAESFNAMVTGLGERERLREAFGAFVDPALTERVLEEGSDLTGEEVDVSILFLDVREFTAFAESAPARDVVAALNALYDLIVPVVIGHGGHANRFLGDGLLAVFGAPERQVDHATRAVDAALEITKLVRHRDDDALRIGIGVNSGRVVAGTIGGGGRRDFTVIGDPVNTAARVEAATRLTGDDLLITEATLHSLDMERRRAFVERPRAPLRGKSDVVRLYAPRHPDDGLHL
ncbi:MAG: adenylate/guanylate cyclase domain-containing protein [Mycobacteriales bacterium]